MSAEAETPPAAEPAAWPVLGAHERRVLGVLVEKSKTTPDVYPMSLNALTTGCNQKNNRDPVLSLTEDEVEEALLLAKQKGLAIQITGGRVVRWRQALYEAWKVGKVELAVLAELLLRGPQTEGELRSRASRMAPIPDLDALREVLHPLAERGLVVYLTAEGRRGTVLTHGFHAPDELERLRARHGSEAASDDSADAPPAPRRSDAAALEAQLAEAQAEVAQLRDQVGELRADLAGLAEQVRAIKEALGMTAGERPA